MTDAEIRLDERLEWLTQTHHAGFFSFSFDAEINALIILLENEEIAIIPASELKAVGNMILQFDMVMYLAGIVE